jgi:hypothetical protein
VSAGFTPDTLHIVGGTELPLSASWSAEQGEHPVTCKILDSAPEAFNTANDSRHRFADDQPCLLRVKAVGQPGRADHIRAKRSHGPPLLAHRPLISHRRILAGAHTAISADGRVDNAMEPAAHASGNPDK